MAGECTSHWEAVYRSKPATGVSWYAPHLQVSLALLQQTGLTADTRVIDIGGGACTLVDDLLELGLRHVTVLDLSRTALAMARQRLGVRAEPVRWLTGDLLDTRFEEGAFDRWHDRAVLHFLVEPAHVHRYAAQAACAVRRGGYAVIGGFAPDGPQRCSGLPVARRCAADLATLLAPAFRLVDERHEHHPTPGGVVQAFAYALLERV